MHDLNDLSHDLNDLSQKPYRTKASKLTRGRSLKKKTSKHIWLPEKGLVTIPGLFCFS